MHGLSEQGIQHGGHGVSFTLLPFEVPFKMREGCNAADSSAHAQMPPALGSFRLLRGCAEGVPIHKKWCGI